jgi:hypothetical protein
MGDGSVKVEADENLENDERVVKILNSLATRMMYSKRDSFSLINRMQEIGEAIIAGSEDMSVIQDDLLLISEKSTLLDDGLALIVF